MRKRSVFVIVGMAAAIATSARAEVNLTQTNAAKREIHRGHGRTAASGAVSLIDNSGLEWFLNTDVTAATAFSASGAASDATYTTAVAATTVGAGTAQQQLNNAFDGYQGLVVDVSTPSGTTGPTIYTQNGPASTTCFGQASQVNRELLYDAQLVGTVSVRRRVFVPEDDSFARWLDVFTNTGSVAVNVTVSTANNLGSGGLTLIDSSSDGNATASNTDTWVTTFENYTGTTSPSPRLGHVIQGTGAAVPASQVFFANASDTPTWAYNITLQPRGTAGDSATIANFATGQPSKVAARAKATTLATFPTPATTTTCMAPMEVDNVVNFATPARTEWVANGGFEATGGTVYHPVGWSPNEIGDGNDDGVYCEPDGAATTLVGGTNAVDGQCFFRVRGEGFGPGGARTEEGYKYLRQIRQGPGPAGSYTFSAWAKSLNASFGAKKKFEAVAIFKLNGGGKKKKILKFTRGTHDWELQSSTFNLASAFKSVTIELHFFDQGPQGNNQPTAGLAYFDGVSLVQ